MVCREKFPKEYNWLVSLVRGFRDGGADFIIVDDRRQRFQIEATGFAEKLGLVTFKETGSDEAQYTAWEFRLTELGKTVILDKNAPGKYLT